MHEGLVVPFMKEEVDPTISQMHPKKSPGSDDMSTIFYQKFKGIVGKDVMSISLDILNDGVSPEMINHTHLMLIPKKKTSSASVNFRPISLCNVFLKLLLKSLLTVLNLSPLCY